MKHRRAALAALALALLLGGAGGGTAGAQTASQLDVRVREVTFEREGVTRVTASVTGSAVPTDGLQQTAFSVTEQGQPVTGLTAEPLFRARNRPVAVALVIDVSGSTRGNPLDVAKAAARDFIEALPVGVRIAVLTIGTTAELRQSFTTERAVATAAVNGIQTQGRSAVYDGLSLAAQVLERQVDAQRNIVMFGDARDTASRADLQDVIRAARSVGAPISTVALTSQVVDEEVAQQLARAVRGGRVFRAADFASLAASLGSVAQSISSQYLLTYRATALEPRELNIAVTVSVGGVTASDTSNVLNRRTRELVPVQPERSKPLVPALASRLGLYLGFAGVFLVLMLFFGYPLSRPASKEAERVLARSLRPYEEIGVIESRKSRRARGELGSSKLAGTAFGKRLVEMAARVPRPKDYDERMQKLLEQAGWPLRSTEFIAIQIAAIGAGAMLGFGLFLKWWIGIMLIALGAIAPRVLLTIKIQRRNAAFLSQLPESLQLLAGSLQAGYGFVQALDTLSKETPPPTSEEFARVIAEARLGISVETALDNMADRMAGEDFRWVVLAVNIQRQVGGNLATLLHTVADTLRERESVRRQIKTLSAEGRLSGVILVALPFVLFAYLSLVNPEYLGLLTNSPLGRIAIVVALVLIGVGIVWMRKIVNIDV